MNASRRALSQGQQQLRCSSRLAVRSFSSTVRFSAAYSSSPSSASSPSPKTETSSPKTTTAAKPASAQPTPASRPASTKPFSKPFSTSSSKAATAIPSELFYQATTIANAEGSADAVVPTVDWSASFYGIASRPATSAQFAALMRPLNVDDIEVKPDGIIYLPEIRYRRRLNEAFGPMGWGLIPKGDAVVGDSIVTREYALIVDGR